MELQKSKKPITPLLIWIKCSCVIAFSIVYLVDEHDVDTNTIMVLFIANPNSVTHYSVGAFGP